MLESEQFEIKIKPENTLKKDNKDRGNLCFYAYFRGIQFSCLNQEKDSEMNIQHARLSLVS